MTEDVDISSRMLPSFGIPAILQLPIEFTRTTARASTLICRQARAVERR